MGYATKLCLTGLSEAFVEVYECRAASLDSHGGKTG
jgi:hypothetical protein